MTSDISSLVKNQRKFFLTGNTRSYEFRIAALKKLYKHIKENEDKISAAVKKDLNKDPFETYMCETGLVLDEIRFHIKHLKKWMTQKNIRTPLAQFPSKSFISPEPYGVVLIMSPWNYPIQLCLEPLIGAISAGNCAIIKPSAYAPASGKMIVKMISDIFPEDYIAVVEGGRSENTALLNEKFDYIFFTGSVAVGKTVMSAASKYLTPLTLELGGKSPVIIDDTADMKLAARRLAFGKVLNAGQTCVGPDYLLLKNGLFDSFIDNFKVALNEFFPSKDMSDMVNIISEKHFKRIERLLDGQKIAIGGNCDRDRLFIEPTVLKDVDKDSPIMQEEIFGPILPVITWNNIDEVTTFINSRPKPLALYLFTKDHNMEKHILNSCSFGGGCINDTIIHLATSYMGFGGVGESGMGQYHGKKSFETFTHYRSIVKKSCLIDLPIRYFPYTASKSKLLHKFLR